MFNMQGVQYIKVLTQDLKHREYQWKFGLNSIDAFNTTNECTSNALYVCEIKDFFKWILLYPNIAYVGYVTIPDDAKIVVTENKIKINKVILNGPLIPLFDFVDVAIKHGANIHHNNDVVLRLASGLGYLDIVKCLVNHGADIHARNDEAICVASENGHLDVVEYLIKHGIDVHTNNSYCICCASHNGHLAVVECLIKYGADIHACNDDALRWAYKNGHSDIVKCLIKHAKPFSWTSLYSYFIVFNYKITK